MLAIGRPLSRHYACFHTPQQNIVYADTTGNIGFLSPGRIPIRKQGTGNVPVAGWSGEYDWIGFIPFEALPQQYNPPTGRILNANNAIVGEDYPYLLNNRWALGYRAKRIEEHLSGDRRQHTVESSIRLQQDIVSLAARRLLPYLVTLDNVTDEISSEVLTMLKGWDGRMDRHRPEPLVYATWVRELILHFFKPILKENYLDSYWEWPESLVKILSGTANHDWCPGDQGCRTVLQDTFHKTIHTLTERYREDIKKWRWGDVHQAALKDDFVGNIPILRDLWRNIMETHGGNYTVNRGLSPLTKATAPYSHTDGPGYRAVYDLADLKASRFIITPGQSSHLLSRHYSDLMRMWRDGEYIMLKGTQNDLRKQGGSVLILEPKAVPQEDVPH